MTIPSESDLLAELNILASYEDLKKEGSFSRLLPLVAMLRKDGSNSSSTSNQFIPDATAIKQDEQSKILEDIRAKLPTSAISSEDSLLGLSNQVTTLLSNIPAELSTDGRFKVQVDTSELPIGAATETTLTDLRDKLVLLLTLLPNALSSTNRLRVESNVRSLTVNDDKVGATIEASVLPTNAASNTSVLEISQKLTDLIALLPTNLSNDGKFEVNVNSSSLPINASTETTLAKLPIQLGSITEVAAINETSSSGLNGLLRLLITRVTSLLPTSLSNGRFKVEQRGLNVSTDKVGVVVESTVLGSDAALDSTLVSVKNQIGSVTETIPSSPTASSGLNGLLRLLFSKLPDALSSGRFKVEQRNLTIATDKVGVAIESTVLPPNAASDSSLVTLGNQIGLVTEEAPASATASSGLNGLLRLLFSKLPGTLSASGNFKVETTVLPPNASTDASLVAIYNRLYKAPWFIYNHTNTATACIKPSLGFLHSFYCTNLSTSSTYFLQFFNKAVTATNGDTPVMVAFELLAGDTIAIGDTLLGERGIGFDTGLTYGFSTQRDIFQAISTPNDLRVTFYYE